MKARGLALFDTAIGRCGVVWSEAGLVSVHLPETDDGETRARIRRQFPEASEAVPPAEIRRAIDKIVALLRGEASDLPRVTLDMEGIPPFHQRVYEVTRTIPPGTTLTYGEVAARLGVPGSARAVGQALGRNPFVIVIPCHRVVPAGGKLGGFSAAGGTATKRRLLSIEGAPVAGTLPLFEDASDSPSATMRRP
ncbi:MAG: methylated-DNA--[protein]-cysteine S-methyltransferase [Chloroflexi bacterium]|nr:methylated-DNA--[protein]-cysteine S-methyltransferase [Chloroflexota bacterium]